MEQRYYIGNDYLGSSITEAMDKVEIKKRKYRYLNFIELNAKDGKLIINRDAGLSVCHAGKIIGVTRVYHVTCPGIIRLLNCLKKMGRGDWTPTETGWIFKPWLNFPNTKHIHRVLVKTRIGKGVDFGKERNQR